MPTGGKTIEPGIDRVSGLFFRFVGNLPGIVIFQRNARPVLAFALLQASARGAHRLPGPFGNGFISADGCSFCQRFSAAGPAAFRNAGRVDSAGCFMRRFLVFPVPA